MNAVVTKSAVTLSLAAALLWPAVSAHADRIEGVTVSVPVMKVSYADLDITKAPGLEVLYGRIQRAARTVCDHDFRLKELARSRLSRECYNHAIDDAVTQINRPTLTAFHRAKTRPAVG